MTSLLVLVFVFGILLIPITFVVIMFYLPYVPAPRKSFADLVPLAKIKKGDVVFDLGSGDGRALFAAARAGAQAYGWEINPFLVMWTKLMALALGLSTQVTVYWKPYQKAPLEKADVIFVYVLPGLLHELEDKFIQEAREGTKIITCKFHMQKLEEEKSLGDLHLYKVK
jgi:ribosomal protein L11 methylase PrmA